MNNLQEADFKINSNYKYANKINYKHKQNIMKATAIKDYLNEKGFYVPHSRQSFKIQKKKILENSDFNIETGEIYEYANLFNAYYDLNQPLKAVLGEFKKGEKKAYQIIMSQYSRNKIDSIYNYKKSKTARRVWIEYLKNNPALISDYYPMHLTLTVPHKDGQWRGQEFFSRELLREFNLMRKEENFKDFIHGGVYNIETTKSRQGNGNHTHLHALIFQKKSYSKKNVGEWMKKEWSKRTGAKEYLVHYQNLFVHKKDEKGRWIIETVIANNQEVQRKKRFELTDKNKWYRELSSIEKVENMSIGILETLKYHFKEDAFKDDLGNYDVDFINEILNSGKGLRFYSKFGAFYGVSELNMNPKKEEEKEEEETEVIGSDIEEEDFKTDVNRALPNTFNPLTKELANFEEVQLKVIGVDRLKFLRNANKKTCRLIPNQSDLKSIDRLFTIKQIAGCLARNQIGRLTREIIPQKPSDIQVVSSNGFFQILGIKNITRSLIIRPEKTCLHKDYSNYKNFAYSGYTKALTLSELIPITKIKSEKIIKKVS